MGGLWGAFVEPRLGIGFRWGTGYGETGGGIPSVERLTGSPASAKLGVRVRRSGVGVSGPPGAGPLSTW